MLVHTKTSSQMSPTCDVPKWMLYTLEITRHF